MKNIQEKVIEDLKYDFIEVAPNDFEAADKRVWQIVYVYRKGRLIAEGRAACCLADIKNKLYDMEQGYEIATGRARIAVENKRSYGKLPGGYFKGAYYGQVFCDVIGRMCPVGKLPIRPLTPSPRIVESSSEEQPNFCPRCGKELFVDIVLSYDSPLSPKSVRRRAEIEPAVKKCAPQQ